MKKIISGHVYDSDKAREIGSWHNGQSDLNAVESTLYRTKAGYYFLLTEGGANTAYAESLPNNEWIAGERITPMSEAAAKDWSEERLDGDAYIAAFGEPVEEPGRIITSVSLSPEARGKLEDIARRESTSMSAAMEALIVRA